MPETINPSEVLTIMFVDIASSTKTTAKRDTELLHQLQEVFEKLSRRIIRRYEGNLIKKINDAFLITFHSATNALLSAIELQAAFAHYNTKNKPEIKIRIVVHTGEIVHRQNDISGEAVKTASRMGHVAKASDIIFSEASFLTMDQNEIPYQRVGYRTLSGLRYPLRLYKVTSKYTEIMQTRRLHRREAAKFKSVILLLLWLGLVTVAGYLLLMYWLF